MNSSDSHLCWGLTWRLAQLASIAVLCPNLIYLLSSVRPPLELGWTSTLLQPLCSSE